MSDASNIRLRFDDSSHEDVEITRLGDRSYRLNSTPLLATERAYAGDVVQADPLADGTHRFVRVVERAAVRHYSWIVPRGWSDSPNHAAYVALVEATGGTWEQVMGGVLLVHIPIASDFDAHAELDRYLKSEWPEA